MRAWGRLLPRTWPRNAFLPLACHPASMTPFNHAGRHTSDLTGSFGGGTIKHPMSIKKNAEGIPKLADDDDEESKD